MNKLLSTAQIGSTKIITVAIDKDRKNDIDQLSLFDKRTCRPEEKEQWFADTLEIAATMRCPFWPSELRDKCVVDPYDYHWWGTLTKKFKALGYKTTGRFQKSPVISRRGGMELEWTKEAL